jgi:hypothetical protein
VRVLLVVGVLMIGPAVSACTDSSEPQDPPTLDRIDGPATVDPSFDPFATVPPATDAAG